MKPVPQPGGKNVERSVRTSAETRILKRDQDGRKPSERFTRKPLTAKSRASQSERFKVADLVNKLEKDAVQSANCEMKWNGYKPGHAGNGRTGQTGEQRTKG